jgi:hypothetical protein
MNIQARKVSLALRSSSNAKDAVLYEISGFGNMAQMHAGNAHILASKALGLSWR